jgi:hypothetical protein
MMKGLFIKAISRMSPSCRDMSRLCSQSLDRTLTLRKRICMRMHGWICSWCIDYSDQVHKVSSTVREEGESLAELKDDKLSEDCKARMRAIMEASSKGPE